MPQDFLNCVKAKGSHVRTIVPKKGTYLRVCYLNGKSYSGEVRHKQSDAKRGIIKDSINKVKK